MFKYIILLLLPISLFAQKKYKVSIEMDASSEYVFNYLGNSNNVNKWSVFVDSIAVLNPFEFNDGDIGSIRRCYVRNSNKKWDEEIVEITSNKYRLLRCFNYQNFKATTPYLFTEQIYEDTGINKCLVTFTIILNEKPTIIQRLGVIKTQSIFRKNLKNIKLLTSNPT